MKNFFFLNMLFIFFYLDTFTARNIKITLFEQKKCNKKFVWHENWYFRSEIVGLKTGIRIRQILFLSSNYLDIDPPENAIELKKSNQEMLLTTPLIIEFLIRETYCPNFAI